MGTMPSFDTRIASVTSALVAVALMAATACGPPPPRVLTMSGSLLGREGDVLRRQLERFRQTHPGITVELRPTPDAADQRHQLYVQWLNAHVSEPDVLQLDVVWTPEFAAAGWIRPLDAYRPPVAAFFPATVAANQWLGRLFALPWFVDVGMLYWRTDLMESAPTSLDALVASARQLQADRGIPFGLVWQGARYEGLVTVFVEHLGAFGGAIMDAAGAVTVDSTRAVQALTFMRAAIHDWGVVPEAALTWQEEQTRFAFQNAQAVFMRNWPYAFALLADGEGSAVANHFAVTTMPAQPGGVPTATLGGSTLAVNAFSDQPEEAYQLIAFLLEPEQMMERARVAGQFPSRAALYDDPALTDALGIPADDARRVIAAATPRPVSPVYSQLSAILQVSLHRALTRQQEPAAALAEAAAAMRTLLESVRLSSGNPGS
jgi:ABC-type glycerol-3-phosphate transport system substrate-binding protein